jgi:hypothetical protein
MLRSQRESERERAHTIHEAQTERDGEGESKISQGVYTHTERDAHTERERHTHRHTTGTTRKERIKSCLCLLNRRTHVHPSAPARAGS